MEAEHDHDHQADHQPEELPDNSAYVEVEESELAAASVPHDPGLDTVPMNGIFPISPDGDYIFSTDPSEARAISQQVNLEEDAKRRADRNSARKDRYEDHAEEMEDQG